jgi:WD40 repeat protein
MGYDAFVSYSHTADGRLAPSLQRAMQRMARPWYRLRSLRVFLDNAALTANPGLWSSIQQALDDSEWFVLLASPNAAASPWVNREVDYWLEHKSVARLLPVVTDGTWEWTTDGLSGTAVPDALHDMFEEEPRHADLRWARDADDLDAHNARFRDVVAELAAPIHGVAKDDLESEDKRLQRRARRLARGAVGLLSVLLAIALVTTGLALVQRSRANREKESAQHEATVADAGRLAAQARSLGASHIDLALLLAVESRRLDDSVASRGALEATLLHTAGLDRLTQFGSASSGAALSGDGRLLAIGRTTGDVDVREVATDRPVSHFVVGTDPVAALALTADGSTLAAGRPDGTVDLRDAVTGDVKERVTSEGKSYGSLAFSPDGTWLAGTDSQGNVVLWDLAAPTRQTTLPLDRADRRVFSRDVWSPDSRTLVAIDTAGVLTFWDVATRAPVGDPIATHVPVANTAVAFSPDGRTLAVGTAGGGVSLYDAQSHVIEGSPLPLVGRLITWLTFSPDSQTLATCDTAGVVTFWDTASRATRGPTMSVGLTAANRAGVLVAADRPDAPERLVTIGPDTAAVWDVASRTPALGTVLHQFPSASGALLTADGATLEMADQDSDYVFLDVRNHHEGVTGSLAGQPQGLWGAFSPDGTGIASAYTDGTVVWHDVSDAGSRTYSGHVGPALVTAFSPDGRRLAAGGVDGTVVVWDVATTQPMKTLGDGGAATWGVAFSPDGRLLAVDNADGAVTLYDAATYRPLRTFAAHEDALHLAFSPDSRTLAIAGSAGTLLLDAATAQPLGPPLTGHTALVFDVTYSRDGRVLATASDDGTIVLYDVATRLAIGDPLAANDGRASGVALTPDGRTLFSSHDGGEVVQWDIDADSWQQHACATAGRNLTRDEWRTYLGTRPYQPTCAQWPAGK